MGLLDKRNIDKVKALAEKNKAKIADGVTKATSAIDKKTDGKYADKLKKIDEAAKKHGGDADGADAAAADGASTSDAGTETTDETTDETSDETTPETEDAAGS